MHQRSEINQAWRDEISATEKPTTVTGKDDYAAKLAKREIAAPWFAKLNADLKRARTLAGQATRKTTCKKVVTQEEQALRDTMIGQTKSVQSVAKQKYFAKNKLALADYSFCQNLAAMSRAALETCAANILAKARDAALQRYEGVETDQAGEQSGATSARKALGQLVKEIANQRRIHRATGLIDCCNPKSRVAWC